VTTLGSYATAPNQIVLLMMILPNGFQPRGYSRLPRGQSYARGQKSGNSQDRLGDKLAQDVAGRGHDDARVRVAEQTFNFQ